MNWKCLAAAALGILVPGMAMAFCPDTSVTKLEGICLDAQCPPGTTAYMVTIQNNFPNQLYITYAFRRPDMAIITAGLTLRPGLSRMPLGFGPTDMPHTEDEATRIGRLRILECGANPDIIYRWRRK